MSNILIPQRSSDGLIQIVAFSHVLWPDLDEALSKKLPHTLVSFLPPEWYLEQFVLTTARARNVPYICGSVYDLSWATHAIHFAAADCIVTTQTLAPFILNALTGSAEPTKVQRLLLVADDSAVGKSAVSLDIPNVTIEHLSYPIT